MAPLCVSGVKQGCRGGEGRGRGGGEGGKGLLVRAGRQATAQGCPLLTSICGRTGLRMAAVRGTLIRGICSCSGLLRLLPSLRQRFFRKDTLVLISCSGHRPVPFKVGFTAARGQVRPCPFGPRLVDSGEKGDAPVDGVHSGVCCLQLTANI